MRTIWMVLLLASVTLAGCGTGERTAVEPVVGQVADAPDWQPDRVGRTPELRCDPGGGFPRATRSCPVDEPVTGWVVGISGPAVTVRLFRTYVDDLEGREYAQAHGLEFPFPNDHYDAGLGERRVYAVDDATVCTGISVVGHRSPVSDHRVDCDAFARAVSRRASVPAALWLDRDSVVQLSELYRP